MDTTTGATVQYSISMTVDRQQVPASGLSFLTVHGESDGRAPRASIPPATVVSSAQSVQYQRLPCCVPVALSDLGSPVRRLLQHNPPRAVIPPARVCHKSTALYRVRGGLHRGARRERRFSPDRRKQNPKSTEVRHVRQNYDPIG
jgi:hypothetical protein